MHTSKLIALLRQFSAKQQREFRDFLDSPFFNKNEDLIRLFERIMRFGPRFVNKRLSKEALWEFLYPGETFSSKQLSYLSSDLQSLAEQYLSVAGFLQEPVRPAIHALDTLSEWELGKHFQAVMRQAEKKRELLPYRDSSYYFDRFQMASAANLFFDKGKKRRYDQNLQEAVNNLDQYYLILKLKYSCEILNRRNVVAAEYELSFLPEILQVLAENPYPDTPAIDLYHTILLSLMEPENPAHFRRLRSRLLQKADLFPLLELRDMYAYAQNYCARKINTGQMGYLPELFDLYKFGLQQRIFFTEKHLSHSTYKNIMAVALRLGEFPWALEFAESYRDQLAAEFRETAYAYNRANYHFVRGEFRKALRLLQQVEFNDVYYSLDTRAMMLKIYYELNEPEALDSLTISFEAYLKRNKLVSETMRRTYRNLNRFVKKLERLLPGDQKRIQALKSEIAESRAVADKTWLTEKLKELESLKSS